VRNHHAFVMEKSGVRAMTLHLFRQESPVVIPGILRRLDATIPRPGAGGSSGHQWVRGALGHSERASDGRLHVAVSDSRRRGLRIAQPGDEACRDVVVAVVAGDLVVDGDDEAVDLGGRCRWADQRPTSWTRSKTTPAWRNDA
jgi:hypothetical protein